MTVSFAAVVLSTPSPQQLARFYGQLLGWTTTADEPDWVHLRDPREQRPGLSFQLEHDDAPPHWPARPGGVQMQAHLDFLVDDLDAEQARAVALGATVEDHQPVSGVRVMRDPHGHVFCLFLPGF